MSQYRKYRGSRQAKFSQNRTTKPRRTRNYDTPPRWAYRESPYQLRSMGIGSLVLIAQVLFFSLRWLYRKIRRWINPAWHPRTYEDD